MQHQRLFCGAFDAVFYALPLETLAKEPANLCQRTDVGIILRSAKKIVCRHNKQRNNLLSLWHYHKSINNNQKRRTYENWNS